MTVLVVVGLFCAVANVLGADTASAPVWDGKTLLFHNGQGTLAVTPLSDDVIRIHFTKEDSFGRDHSYAVITNNLGDVKAEAKIEADSAVIKTATLKVLIQLNPLRISFADAEGQDRKSVV